MIRQDNKRDESDTNLIDDTFKTMRNASSRQLPKRQEDKLHNIAQIHIMVPQVKDKGLEFLCTVESYFKMSFLFRWGHVWNRCLRENLFCVTYKLYIASLNSRGELSTECRQKKWPRFMGLIISTSSWSSEITVHTCSALQSPRLCPVKFAIAVC